ncbi:DUF6166 domain-containing protein [Nonomuraea sp. NPDC050394]|uniref:DUF6166 domain-containing protein n=1 Tax=Nonomuraea sp. NPDC050394 TaxID=3364363 RepID=UPI003790F8A0
MTSLDVIYHGYRREIGGSFIAVEDEAGQQLGVVTHLPRHSPTGLSWGYLGSGAADCARSLLMAALGDAATCTACAGTRQIVLAFDEATEEITEQPYDPDQAPAVDPELIMSCGTCDDGTRVHPIHYQAFKEEFVARWGEEWTMPREEIVAWFTQQTPC